MRQIKLNAPRYCAYTCGSEKKLGYLYPSEDMILGFKLLDKEKCIPKINWRIKKTNDIPSVILIELINV